MLLHYNQMTGDLSAQIKKISEFLHIDFNSLDLSSILQHCDFGYMKERANTKVPFSGVHMDSAKAFFHKGADRDHKKEPTPEQIKKFNAVALEKMAPKCSHWLETGN